MPEITASCDIPALLSKKFEDTLTPMEDKARRAQVSVGFIVILNVVLTLGYGGGQYPLICCVTSLLTAGAALLAFMWVSLLIDYCNHTITALKNELELMRAKNNLSGK